MLALDGVRCRIIEELTNALRNAFGEVRDLESIYTNEAVSE